MESRRMRTFGAVAAVMAGLLLAAPVAGAHELNETSAESAVERYANSVQGGSTGSLSVSTGDDDLNMTVLRSDVGPCRRKGPHQRVCPVVYEGKDYLDEGCRDTSIVSDPGSDTGDCFPTVVCRQTVTVTLPGAHTLPGRRSTRDRRLSLRASQLSCGTESENAPTVRGARS